MGNHVVKGHMYHCIREKRNVSEEYGFRAFGFMSAKLCIYETK